MAPKYIANLRRKIAHETGLKAKGTFAMCAHCMAGDKGQWDRGTHTHTQHTHSLSLSQAPCISGPGAGTGPWPDTVPQILVLPVIYITYVAVTDDSAPHSPCFVFYVTVTGDSAMLPSQAIQRLKVVCC